MRGKALSILFASIFSVALSSSANSQIQGEVLGVGKGALAAWIKSSRDDAISRGVYNIPGSIRSQIEDCFSAGVFSRAKYRIGGGNFTRLQRSTAYLGDANAVTLDYVIIFRSQADANDAKLWAHELKHVEQYWAWGVNKFAERYIEDVASGETKWGIEVDARAQATAYVARLPVQMATTLIILLSMGDALIGLKGL